MCAYLYFVMHLFILFNRVVSCVQSACESLLRQLLAEIGITNVDAALQALRTHSDWRRLLTVVGNITGATSALSAAVVASLGGRVFYPVTGGAPTSKEVLDWMTATFIPLTTTGIDQR